jgi:DNA-directed RNA polymerase specialized sigma24 family protein
VIHYLRRAVLFSEVAHLTDGELLELFLAHRSEAAFEALIHRHGPMVRGVCRRMIADLHDAEDAFQATFLVLARKAASMAPREGVGNSLYGVAFRAARRARAVSRAIADKKTCGGPKQISLLFRTHEGTIPFNIV